MSDDNASKTDGYRLLGDVVRVFSAVPDGVYVFDGGFGFIIDFDSTGGADLAAELLCELGVGFNSCGDYYEGGGEGVGFFCLVIEYVYGMVGVLVCVNFLYIMVGKNGEVLLEKFMDVLCHIRI